MFITVCCYKLGTKLEAMWLWNEAIASPLQLILNVFAHRVLRGNVPLVARHKLKQRYDTICRSQNPDIQRVVRDGARRGGAWRGGVGRGGSGGDADGSFTQETNVPLAPQGICHERLFGSTNEGNPI